MSIIKSPYEISVWRDEITENGPREQKVCTIGSDKMTSQSRATAPNFVRRANGEKSLTFQMYKQYVDTMTGEKVQNPFVDLITNETKIKLYYEGIWYDFVVKDINENSSTHLCSYTLEDALVKELSRNGFGVILDAELNNNLGDAQTLAEFALAETDWKVKSEVLVEKVEEALIYVQLPAGTRAIHLLDQSKDIKGEYSAGVGEGDKKVFQSDTTVLAFYSCCKNKPYRFQFIYSENGYGRTADGEYNISRKDTRVINQADCQYYIDIGDDYAEPNVETGTDSLGLYLPTGWKIGYVGERWNNEGNVLIEKDSQISSWYRGERYGYAPQSVYVPMLEKYCQRFKDGKGVEYLHYIESKFISPTLVQNVINNYNFESKAGWYGQSGGKAENTYAYYNGETFKTAIESFTDGTYDVKSPYKAYMKLSFMDNKAAILNSGIRDNRTLIKNMAAGEEWILDYTILTEKNKPTNNFEFSIGEYVYNSDSGDYETRASKITFTSTVSNGRIIFKVGTNGYTEETFKDSKLFLKIKPETPGTYYIEKIALYRKSLDKKGQIITPDYEYKIEVDEEGNITDQEISDVAQHFIDTGVVENKYHFFPAEQVNPESDKYVKDKKELSLTTLDKLDYDTFTPVFNEGARKVRTVSVKESNYFDILQTIAETFEAWVDLSIERDDNGYIINKTVSFKNYLGEINYANFKYGVNLKDIQRTSNSKNIVSKLIVKQNTNELGKDGFCTIQRANSNPTGENYIYDFQYYHNQGLMDVNEYLNTVYYLEGAEGPDYEELWRKNNEIKEDTRYNLNGYNLRIKKINDTIQPINEEIIGLTQQLVDKQAEQEFTKFTNEAATSELEKIRTDFKALFGVYPENSSPDSILEIKKASADNFYEKDTSQDWWDPSNKYSDPFNLSFDNDNKIVNGKINIVKEANFERTAKFKLKLKYRCRKYQITDGVNYLYGTYQFIDKPTAVGGWAINLNTSNQPDSNSPGFYIKPYDGIPVSPYNEMVIYREPPYGVFAIKYNNTLAYIESLDGISTTNYSGWQGGNFSGYPQIITFDTPFYIDNNDYSYFYDWFIENTTLVEEGGKIEPTGSAESLWIERVYDIKVIVPAQQTTAYFSQKMDIVDTNNRTVQTYFTDYATNLDKEKTSAEQLPQLELKIKSLEEAIASRQQTVDRLTNYKRQLNNLFFKKYGSFISEGTWIDEKYTDDDKYYADAQSVLYNSCYPQIQYNINVLFLSKLPGYELFKFGLGDKTNVIDDDFFGKDKKQEVVITEITEVLDDPTRNTIKVQTFKNQFQDLFQKITATVQQTQYNAGSYEKGEKFLNANLEKQSEFITNAINSAQDYLQYGQTVKSGNDGITITDNSDKQAQLRLVGGAILFSTTDPETKEVAWRTGLTNKGISADLITAGQLDAGLIQIISSEGPTFRWDAYGLTAYDAYWSDIDNIRVITDIDTSKFVRFDKHGIYGVNHYPGIKGSSWVPKDAAELDRVSTFSLTWEGLKVTGNGGIVARIGKNDGSIIKIAKGEENLFMVSDDGNLEISGKVNAKSGGSIGGFIIGTLESIDPETNNITKTDALFYKGEGLNGQNIYFSITPHGCWQEFLHYKENYQLNLVLRIGENFGIGSDGTIYTNNAQLSGRVDATAGTLQNLTINGLIKIGEEDENGISPIILNGEKGNIYLQSGSIIQNASGCRWSKDGLVLLKGRVGTWGIDEKDNNSNKGLISDQYTLRLSDINYYFATKLQNKELILNRYPYQNAKDPEETFIVKWQSIVNFFHQSYSTKTGTDVILSNLTLGTGVQLGTGWIVNDNNLISVGRYDNYTYYLEGDRLKSYNTKTNEIKYTLWSSIMNHVGATTSDARVKKDIEILNNKYNTFFDTLQPKRYKYIDGTSNRYHTGFIAQEIVQALEDSGLNTLDFAAVMLEPDDDGPVWRLRRDEFVALNTWQIQLLKPRVAAIEEKISQLEAELAELKSKI